MSVDPGIESPVAYYLPSRMAAKAGPETSTLIYTWRGSEGTLLLRAQVLVFADPHVAQAYDTVYAEDCIEHGPPVRVMELELGRPTGFEAILPTRVKALVDVYRGGV